jgi:hypothetical protein
MASTNITIHQGATWRHVLILKNPDGTPVNLTGCAARMQARTDYADRASGQPLVELSTANGKIALTPLEGKLTLALTAAETEAIKWRHAVYDVEVTFADSTIRRVLEGRAEVKPEVTR